MRKAARAWGLSVLAFMALLALWSVASHLATGRLSYLLHNTVDLALGFGAVFAVALALVHVPIFALTDAFRSRRLTRRAAAWLGAALAPCGYLMIAWRFGEFDGRHSIAQWLLYSAAQLPAVMLALLPYVLAGALFGVLWHTALPLRSTIDGHSTQR